MFRVGLAGYDLWPHTLAFVRALEGADFCKIVAVWDEDPQDLELLVAQAFEVDAPRVGAERAPRGYDSERALRH